jgi:hypothetical protein
MCIQCLTPALTFSCLRFLSQFFLYLNPKPMFVLQEDRLSAHSCLFPQ